MKAFRIICNYFDPPIKSICKALSPQKARFLCWKSANEAGYSVSFGQLKVCRAREYDGIKLVSGKCYDEEFVSQQLPTV